MSNIFMSYSREDRPTAERLAAAFTSHDFTVWWDRNIPTGGTFDTIIEQELNSADCVVVLWSKTSVESNWVKEEAGRGLERNALVPVLIDQVQIPLGFGRIEGAELWDWKGDKKHPEFVQLIQSLRAKTGRTDSHPTLRPVPAPPHSVVRARIDAIESIIAGRGTIATAANAKMCRRVSNLNCSGEAAVFNR